MKNTLLFSGLMTGVFGFLALVLFIVLGFLTQCFGLGCNCYQVMGITVLAISVIALISCLVRNCKKVS